MGNHIIVSVSGTVGEGRLAADFNSKYIMEQNRYEKRTEEYLTKAVSECSSMTNLTTYLGAGSSGSCWMHLKKRLARFNISTSHFITRPFKGGGNKVDINIRLTNRGVREKSYTLRKCVLESGIDYVCLECGLKEWQGKPLTLQVDHINGVNTDNRIENLRFLCPNCHSQTETYGYKGKK